MIDIRTGKQMTRGGFLKGILASGIAPSITLATIANAASANASVARGMMRNVGARQVAMFGGGKQWSYPLEPDIMWLSGEWNNGRGIHSDSTTTWKSVVGSGWDFELSSNGWFWQNDGLRLDGTASTGWCGKNNKTLFDPLGCTIEAVFSIDDISSSSMGTEYMQMVIWLQNFTGIMANSYYARGARLGVEFCVNKGFDVSTTPLKNTLIYVANSGINTENILYLNGEPRSASGSYINGAGSNFVTIGGQSNGGRKMQGVIKEIRLHRSRLSASEIAANYAIDKARFYLP